MKVIILAAGRGTRISKLIGEIPKCTVDIGGQPLIMRTLKMLKERGIDDISIVLGYKNQVISQLIEGLGVKQYINPFYNVTNSIASLWFAKEQFDANEDTVICNGDVFWTDEIFEAIMNADGNIVMLADKKRVDDGDYFFKTNGGVLQAYGKELTRDNRDCEYVGIAKIKANTVGKFNARLCEMINSQQNDKWWENVLYSMVGELKISVEDVGDAFWAEVDFIEDYERIIEFVKTRR